MDAVQVVREMIQREKSRWIIRHARSMKCETEHQRWALYLDGTLFGIWPDADFAVRVRDMHVLWGVMSAAVNGGKGTLGREEAKTVSRFIDESDGSSPICRLRPVLVQHIERRVFWEMEV